MKLAFRFPDDAKTPEMIWVPVEQEQDDDDPITFESAVTKSFLGDDDPYVDTRRTVRDRKLAKDLNHTLTFFFRDAFLKDGSRQNESILNTTKGECVHTWKGPGVVMRQPGTAVDPLRYGDVQIADLTHCINYFATYTETYVEETENPYKPRPGPKIQCVRINCPDDQKRYGRPKFDTVNIQESLLYGPKKLLQVASRVGVPLCLTQSSHFPDVIFADPDLFNEAASALCYDVDPGARYWGMMVNQNEILEGMQGTVIAFRQDRRPISQGEVADLCDFCASLAPEYENVLGAGFVSKTKEEVLAVITPNEFSVFKSKRKLAESTSAK